MKGEDWTVTNFISGDQSKVTEAMFLITDHFGLLEETVFDLTINGT